MSTVTIDIDSRWVKIACSPLFWIVATLQGISVICAPWSLYLAGKGKFFPGFEWIVVPSCFAVMLLVAIFYLQLGGEVIRQLRKKKSAA